MAAHACLDPAASLNLRVVGALIARERRLTVLPCPSRTWMHVEHYGGPCPVSSLFFAVFNVLPAPTHTDLLQMLTQHTHLPAVWRRWSTGAACLPCAFPQVKSQSLAVRCHSRATRHSINRIKTVPVSS